MTSLPDLTPFGGADRPRDDFRALEPARCAALARYDVQDDVLDDVLQALAAVAASTCGTAISLLSFVDADLQRVRAASGLDLNSLPSFCCPRHLSLCHHAMRGCGVLVVADTAADERFHRGGHVAWQRGIRFYAGAPLITPDHFVIGTLSVLDPAPGTLTLRQRRSLTTLADEAVALLPVRWAG